MDKHQIIQQLRSMIVQGSAIAHERLRVEGDFLANPPAAPASGLRVVAPDGSVYYIAAYDEVDFEHGQQNVPEEGSESRKVWELVCAEGPLTSEQVAERLGLPPDAVRSAAQALIDRGLLDRDEDTEQLKVP